MVDDRGCCMLLRLEGAFDHVLYYWVGELGTGADHRPACPLFSEEGGGEGRDEEKEEREKARVREARSEEGVVGRKNADA